MIQFIKSVRLFLEYKSREYLKNSFRDQQSLLNAADFAHSPILDTGAHYGETTAKYTRLFPDRTIYSFEPLPASFSILKERYSNNPHVKPVQMAVSNNTGNMDFYSNLDSATNSLLPATEEAARWSDAPEAVNLSAKIQVNTITIDDFCSKEQIGKIGILKMDLQGGELSALEGASRMLANHSISLVYSELLFVPLYDGQADFNKIYSFLNDNGYNLFALYNFAYSPSGRLKWCDGLFTSPELISSI